MEWRDQGVVVAVRKHGETAAIIEVFTREHGRHAGLVRGGASRKMTPVLQPGQQVEVEWRARLEDHLGNFRVEPLQSRANVLSNRLSLGGLTSICAMISFALPERMVMPFLYDRTRHLLDAISSGEDWLPLYALWERIVLEELGFGLDLSECAATGVTQELIYVSPKSGRSVSREGGQEYVDRLLPLPRFLRDGDTVSQPGDVESALKTTGYFLEQWLARSLGDRGLPEARNRFVLTLKKHGARLGV